MAWSGQRITNDVKSDAFQKISSLSLDFFQRTTTNELISRIETDGGTLNNVLKLGLSDLVKEPSTIVFMLGFMFLIDWKFTLISLMFAPLCVDFFHADQVDEEDQGTGTAGFCDERGAGERDDGIVPECADHQGSYWAGGGAHGGFFREGGAAVGALWLNMKSAQSREILGPIVQTLSAMGISAVLLYAFWTHCTVCDKIRRRFIAALGAFSTPVLKKMNHLGVYFTQIECLVGTVDGTFQAAAVGARGGASGGDGRVQAEPGFSRGEFFLRGCAGFGSGEFLPAGAGDSVWDSRGRVAREKARC